MDTYDVFIDGSSRPQRHMYKNWDIACRTLGSTHPSAVGIVVKKDSSTFHSISEQIGIYDNNHAEFIAMIRACKELIRMNIERVRFFTDNLVLVERVMDNKFGDCESLNKLALEIKKLLDHFESFTLTWIPRTENREADRLAYMAFAST